MVPVGPDPGRPAAGVHLEHPVRGPDHRLGHVADPDAARRHAPLAAAVGVAVHGQVRAPGVDGLGQQVAAEERVDLQPLTDERLLDRRVVRQGDADVGVAGTPGFGGGFPGASCSEFGEPLMKAFVRHTKKLARGLERALAALRADRRIALLHYSPVAETLAGEPREIYPFLGSYLLAEAVDEAGADLVVHGHAHRGSERGRTPGGVRVRNVARPVIGSRYRVFSLSDGRG